MYLRIVNENITYPYSIEQLRQDNYNVSFPINLTTELLSEWGVFAVQQTTKPNDYTKNIVEGTPTLIDGVYYQNWVQSDATEAEIADKIENKWIDDAGIEAAEARVKALVDESVQFAEESPYPEADELYKDVYAEPNYPYINE